MRFGWVEDTFANILQVALDTSVVRASSYQLYERRFELESPKFQAQRIIRQVTVGVLAITLLNSVISG